MGADRAVRCYSEIGSGRPLSLGRSQVTLQAEIIALRHQLIVLQRAQNLSPKTASEVMVC